MRNPVMILIFVSSMLLTSCGIGGGGGAQVTATPASWDGKASGLVRQINSYLMNMDPVGYVIDAQFQVVDVTYEPNDGSKPPTKLSIEVNCKGTCTRERSFAVIISALKAKYPEIKAALPAELKEFFVITDKDMKQKEIVEMKWVDVSSYLTDGITGAQLAKRMK